jgi:hypothetical protein
MTAYGHRLSVRYEKNRRVPTVGDFGQKIELSVGQLERLAEEVLSPRFRLITGL